MELYDFFPGVWETLSQEEQDTLQQAVIRRQFSKGTVIHNGSADCDGLYAILEGQMRVYTLSAEGREVTLYRLFARDMCLLSASCIISNIQFEVVIAAERDVDVLVIPPRLYQTLMETSPAIANYTNALMSSRFSEVMWLLEQILWSRMDQRLAEFLVGESRIEESHTLSMTHEKIASHLGSAREVVTRMLKYFQEEGMVKLSRGTMTLIDLPRLEALAQGTEAK